MLLICYNEPNRVIFKTYFLTTLLHEEKTIFFQTVSLSKDAESCRWNQCPNMLWIYWKLRHFWITSLIEFPLNEILLLWNTNTWTHDFGIPIVLFSQYTERRNLPCGFHVNTNCLMPCIQFQSLKLFYIPTMSVFQSILFYNKKTYSYS